VDLDGIVIRTVLSYLTLLVLVRSSGKLSVRSASTFEFVVALIVGDIVDNAIWAEVPPLQFLVAAVSLFATHWTAKSVGNRYESRTG
jgi:uncharacterized membrane protein YcaP (DUF421 family)